MAGRHQRLNEHEFCKLREIVEDRSLVLLLVELQSI